MFRQVTPAMVQMIGSPAKPVPGPVLRSNVMTLSNGALSIMNVSQDGFVRNYSLVFDPSASPGSRYSRPASLLWVSAKRVEGGKVAVSLGFDREEVDLPPFSATLSPEEMPGLGLSMSLLGLDSAQQTEQWLYSSTPFYIAFDETSSGRPQTSLSDSLR